MRLPTISLVLLLAASGEAGAQTQVRRFDRLPGDPLLAIIDHVPSFAGMWIDSTSTLHALLTDSKDSSSLRELLRVYVSERGIIRGSLRGEDSGIRGIVIETAKYSYAQLFDWKCTIEKAVIDVDGFQTGGVSERNNSVHIGVFKPEGIARVRTIVKGLGIPLDALSVELEGKFSFE